MKKILLYIMMLAGMTACTNEDNIAQEQQPAAGMPLIIYDTDIGSSTDDLFAWAGHFVTSKIMGTGTWICEPVYSSKKRKI